MTAGLDKAVRMYQVDGTNNEQVQSVFFPDMPVHTAAFTAGGSRIVASGRRKFFYTYDVAAGKVSKVPGILGRDERSLETFVADSNTNQLAFLGNAGQIILVSATTCQWMHTLKMNGTVRSAAFSADGRQLMTAGSDGEIYLWDLRKNRCIHRGTDEGGSPSVSLAISQTGDYVACGSDSGVVNVYDGNGDGFGGALQRREQQLSGAAGAAGGGGSTFLSRPSPGVGTLKPLKAMMNLTTPADITHFNSDGQILAIASSRKKDALRLVHLPSMTTFANWPTSRTPLHYVTAVDFSPNSGFFAVGNSRGRVLLYRLKHFDGS